MKVWVVMYGWDVYGLDDATLRVFQNEEDAQVYYNAHKTYQSGQGYHDYAIIRMTVVL